MIWILARAVSRFQRGGGIEEIEEIHESLWRRQDLKKDLRLLLDRMRDRMSRMIRTKAIDDDIGIDRNDRLLDIREIFRRMQYEAARGGKARLAMKPPGNSVSVWPVYARQRWTHSPLTRLYGSVRYGDIPPAASEVDRANQYWRKFRELMRKAAADHPSKQDSRS